MNSFPVSQIATLLLIVAFRSVCTLEVMQRSHHGRLRTAQPNTPGHTNEYLKYFDSKPGDDGPDLAACTPVRNATGDVDVGEPRRTVVVAKYDEDVSWLKCLPTNVEAVVYQSKDSNAPHFVENVGNEASKYLSYIVEHYDELPDSVMFVQAGRQDWHDPLPKEVLLQKWKWGAAKDHGGMAFAPTNAPCLVEDSVELPPHPDVKTQPVVAEALQDHECPEVTEHSPLQMATVREVWGSVFADALGPLPQRWITHCCAQFEVSRESIHNHPLSFYQSLLSWTMNHDRDLLATEYGKQMRRNHDVQRRDAGHVLEVIWALMFSNPSRTLVSDI